MSIETTLMPEQAAYQTIKIIKEEIKSLKEKIEDAWNSYPQYINHVEKKLQKLQNQLTGEEFVAFMEIWDEQLKNIRKDFEASPTWAELIDKLSNYQTKKQMNEDILLTIFLERYKDDEDFILYDLDKNNSMKRKIMSLKYGIKNVSKYDDLDKFVSEAEYTAYEAKFRKKLED